MVMDMTPLAGVSVFLGKMGKIKEMLINSIHRSALSGKLQITPASKPVREWYQREVDIER